MSSTFKKHTHHVKRKGYLEGYKNLYNHFPFNWLDSQTFPSGVAKLSQPIKNITGAILNKKGVATKFYTKTWKNEFENNFEKNGG